MSVIHKTCPENLIKIVERGVNLPAMSPLGSELMATLHQPADRIDVQKIAALIESDPALAVRVLRMANSPYFGVVRKVTSVAHAITMVGLDETVNYLNFHLLMDVMRGCPTLEGFSPAEFWTHSWACATAARMLGRTQFLVRSSPGELYLAGLLHDIGKIVLSIHLTEDFETCLRLSREKEMPLYEAEREVLGIDHATLGAYLLDKWNIPQPIMEAVAWHHCPDGALEEYRELAALTEFANTIVNRYEVGDGGSTSERDLTQTWICREGKTALASEATREKAIEEILEALEKKADLMHGTETEEEIEPESPTEKNETERGASTSPTGQGDQPLVIAEPTLWSRIAGWFDSLLR